MRTLTPRVRLVLVTLNGLMALLTKLVKPNPLTRRSVVLVLTWDKLSRNVTRLDKWRARPRTSLRPDGAGLIMLLVTPLITVRNVDIGACSLRSIPVITLCSTRLVRRSLLVTLPKDKVSRLILLWSPVLIRIWMAQLLLVTVLVVLCTLCRGEASFSEKKQATFKVMVRATGTVTYRSNLIPSRN